MYKKLLSSLLLATSLMAGSVADKVTIMTESYPPYNMMNNGKLTGISVSILEEMLKEMGSSKSRKDFKLGAWARGYSLTLKKKNYMLFSTTRTQKREKLFKWVGPIVKTKIGLIALKSSKIKVTSLNDLNNYTIGAVAKDVGEQLLQEAKVSQKNTKSIRGKDAVMKSFRKMKKGRIDMFSYNEEVAMYDAKLSGIDISKYEFVYTLKEAELYFAFNKNTDDKIIDAYQKALDNIKSNGKYKNILKTYK